MKPLIYFIIIFVTLNQVMAQELICLACNNGIQTCVTDPANPEKTAVLRKCDGAQCSPCESSGFGNSRFSYGIYDSKNQFIWLGFSNFYTNYQACMEDRNVDIRCH